MTYQTVEVTPEFIEKYQPVIDVMATVKFLAEIDPDQTTANLIVEHPSVTIATTLSVLESINAIQERITEALSGVAGAEVYTRENILLATMVGMQLGAFSLEHELKGSYTELSGAMLTASTMVEPSVDDYDDEEDDDEVETA